MNKAVREAAFPFGQAWHGSSDGLRLYERRCRFEISQVVDTTKGMHALIRKKGFSAKSAK